MHATIRLQLGHSQNARLLRESLPSTYQVIVAQRSSREEAHSFDLGIFDTATFIAHQEMIHAWKEAVAPLYLPILLLCEQKHQKQLPTTVWETIDDMVWMPSTKPTLLAHIRALLRNRQSSLALQQHNEVLLQSQKQLLAANQRLLELEQERRAWTRELANDLEQELDALSKESEQLATQALRPEQQHPLLQWQQRNRTLRHRLQEWMQVFPSVRDDLAR